jgi:hypothetical protein
METPRRSHFSLPHIEGAAGGKENTIGLGLEHVIGQVIHNGSRSKDDNVAFDSRYLEVASGMQ